MRTYSALLVFETVFDSVSSSDVYLQELCQRIFTPRVEVVEHYCSTLLGEEIDVNYEIEGYIELSTGESITRTRIEQLLSKGIYKVRIRTLSSCSSEGGVCALCYHSSRPDEPEPEVGSIVDILPIFTKSTEILLTDSSSSVTLSLSEDSYDSLLVYYKESLLDPSMYSVSGSRMTIDTDILSPDSQVLVRYRSETRVPFMLWLAETYCGSLLGVKPLPRPLLPLPSLQLVELVPSHLVDILLKEMESERSNVPENLVEYAGTVTDLLEKALFCIAIRTIYDAYE